jgi:hypothetical protein
MNSRNHHMWSAVSSYLIAHAGGVRQAPESMGYQAVVFAPGGSPGLSAAHVRLDRPHGEARRNLPQPAWACALAGTAGAATPSHTAGVR